MNKKAENAWCLYDFANSAYAVSILTFIFPFFFKGVLVGDGKVVSFLGSQWEGKSLYPLVLALSILVVLVSSPLIGKWADSKRIRKKVLMVYCILGAFSTVVLGLLPESSWQWGALFFALANIGFSGGNVFYNALIKEVAAPEETARVSAKGWAWGYAGGFLALIFQLAMIMMPESFGIDKLFATRLSLMITGVWWLVWALPLFFWVNESEEKSQEESQINWRSFWEHFKKQKVLWLFLGAFFLYNDAVETTISQASNLAEELLAMKIEEVLQAGVIIQFVAIFGSWLFLALEKKMGTAKALQLALVNWMLIMLWAVFMQSKGEFYVISMWVGMVMGVTQSASRTLFSEYVPIEQSSTYFSFYTLSQKASAMLGPLVFALSAKFFPIRFAIIPLIVMLAGGSYLLWLFRRKRAL